MELRHLEYFLAVVDHDGVTKAAAALRIAQPSLSQMIKTLEKDFGTELFHRVGRRLVLSAAGDALVGPARQMIRDAATARASVQEVIGLTGGRFDLASLSTLAVDPLAPLIGAFRRAFPDVVIGLAEPEDTGSVGDLVRTGQCELGVAHLPLAAGDLVERDLGEQELLVVLPDSLLDPSIDVLALEDLATLPWVASPAGSSTRALLDQSLSSVGVVPHIAVETGHRESIVPLVLAGAGATLLPTSLAVDARNRGARVCTTTPVIRRRVGLVHRAGPLSPAAHAFLALALSA
ncbi:MAG: cynR3 [Amycolatopsis sp.]|jgi:DNA-binding transcriptional LysR family regulator|uniref:LysR family transcriptional regulator n=1 Tax=Amycolatopsis sp. TaxID=37632 RepID=UPI002619C300|nr:LysR family transcriptional regulator [Amycolatopsis sp.]MCU1684728.1 cynR3 [Amycolatopsis sp.]